LASCIAIDAAGIAYIGGYTNSTDFPTAAPAQAKYGGSGGQMISYFGDGFLAAIKPDGSGLVYSTYLGGEKDDGVINLTADSADDVYATGIHAVVDFPILEALQSRPPIMATASMSRCIPGMRSPPR
jgi:hypothetical protein